MFGSTHSQVGSPATTKWSFPKHASEAILYHHDPPIQSNYAKLLAFVSLANSVMVYLGIGFDKDPNLKLDEIRSARFLLFNSASLQPLVEEICLLAQKNQSGFGPRSNLAKPKDMPY